MSEGTRERLARIAGATEVREVCDRLSPLEPAIAEESRLAEEAERRLRAVEETLMEKVAMIVSATEEERDG